MSKIKELRLKKGMTQQEVADFVGMPKRTLENWEYGKNKPAPWVEKLILEKMKTYKKSVDISPNR